jgi:hypothetical protein
VTRFRRFVNKISSRPARIAALLALIIVSALGSFVVLTGQAEAEAYSCTGYGMVKIPIKKNSLALSRWCGQTEGSGRYVSTVGGGFIAPLWVYLGDTSMKVEIFDDHGRVVDTFYTPVDHFRFQANNYFKVRVNKSYPTNGYIRIALLSYGDEIAAVKHILRGPDTGGSGGWNAIPQPTSVPVIHPAPMPARPVFTPAATVAPQAAVITPPATAQSNSTAIPTPAPAPVYVPQTFAETAGGLAHTWTNYANAGGAAGPAIAGGQTVQVSCKVPGFRVADGNTWWYRIASSPWNGAYYVSADAFYNNGQTTGSLKGTPFVDPSVPNC